MKLIIDIPEDLYKWIRDDYGNETEEVVYKAVVSGIPYEERPQGKREFIEILAEYREDDYDTLPEYKGKPYYSIHYRENGEEFVGYGTYKIEVLSRYLRDYFFNTDEQVPTVIEADQENEE